MAFYTNENLKANSPRSNGDTLQIHQQLSPEDYQMQRQLNERADYERYASLNTPTYGVWNPDTQKFISTDPNEIADLNARSEMKRTGLDQYYHPNSAAYYAAFQGIRDKYLQQEMAKKAAIENEGKQLYSNRMGAFDKLIQDQNKTREEAEKNKGLAALRAAQAKEAEARAKSYEGDGMTPAQRRQATEQHRHNLIAETNRRITDYEKIEKDFGLLPPEKRPANYSDIVKAKQVAYSTLDYLMSGGDPEKVMFLDTNSLGRTTDAQGHYGVGTQGLAGVQSSAPNRQVKTPAQRPAITAFEIPDAIPAGQPQIKAQAQTQTGLPKTVPQNGYTATQYKSNKSAAGVDVTAKLRDLLSGGLDKRKRSVERDYKAGLVSKSDYEEIMKDIENDRKVR